MSLPLTFFHAGNHLTIRSLRFAIPIMRLQEVQEERRPSHAKEKHMMRRLHLNSNGPHPGFGPENQVAHRRDKPIVQFQQVSFLNSWTDGVKEFQHLQILKRPDSFVRNTSGKELLSSDWDDKTTEIQCLSSTVSAAVFRALYCPIDLLATDSKARVTIRVHLKSISMQLELTHSNKAGRDL
ncbi:hypothetical protein MHYP_G00240280 [Metynnis hypsauchen]